MRVQKPINNIISAIDKKMGAKTLNLDSGVKLLCEGYSAARGTTYAPIASTSRVTSVRRIVEILDTANQTTGYNDAALTGAVQRLCDGYTEEPLLYSFGALSDLHIQYETGLADFQRALVFLRDKAPFTCICGDLVSFADSANMAQYKNYVEAYAGDMQIYECAGNHETYPALGVGANLDAALWKNTTGKDAFYSFEYGGDMFIFLGLKSERPGDLFPDGGLEWLADTLAANENKRCFIWQHVHDPEDDTADPSHKYSNILNGASGAEFLKLLRRYKNTVWFHGHTHLTLQDNRYPVSEKLGYRSVHVPSLASPRFYDPEADSIMDYYYDVYGNKVWGATLAEGYIVDVYKTKIVLRGIDFAAGANKDEVAMLHNEVYVLDTTRRDT